VDVVAVLAARREVRSLVVRGVYPPEVLVVQGGVCAGVYARGLFYPSSGDELLRSQLPSLANGWQDNELVFPNTLGKSMNAGNFYRREFQPLLERAGLADEGFTFHSLRHTFATTLAAEGVHPSTAQKMLGHSDIRMTLAIYTHATDDTQDAATAALERALG
jgi:integrase